MAAKSVGRMRGLPGSGRHGILPTVKADIVQAAAGFRVRVGWMAVAVAIGGMAGRVSAQSAPRGVAAAGDFHGQVLAYDDAEGYMEFRAQGNRGSRFVVRMDFRGFWVVPQLALTKMVQRTGSKEWTGLADEYLLMPQDVKITADVRGRYCHQHYVKGYLFRSTTPHVLSYNQARQTAPPPEGVQPIIDLYNWYGECERTQTLDDPNWHLNIKVKDQGAIGGTAQITAMLSLGLHGLIVTTHETTLPNAESPRQETSQGSYSFQFIAQDGSPPPDGDVHTRSWPLIRYLAPAFRLDGAVDWQDLRLTTEQSYEVEHFSQPGYGTLLSDTRYRLSASLRIGPTKKLDVFLESVDPQERLWTPQPGQVRTYKLTLEDPGPEDVEAVRFTLQDTSQHPGVAVNAGNHLLHETCPDCAAGKRPETWPWETFMTTGGDDLPVMRKYTHYNDCALDSLPDLFFCSLDNPEEWEFGEGAVSEGLNYTIGQQITREGKPEKEVRIQVRAMDSAAASRLTAEIRIAGVWYSATARGDTADETETALMLPLDRDRDGIHDEWESLMGISEPDPDEDARPAGTGPGDGLCNFEEYRGVVSQGQLRRLNPGEKDVFVHDYSGAYGPALAEVRERYRPHKLHLQILRGDEFKYDAVNYLDTPYKQGDQYLLVVMTHGQVPGLDMTETLGQAAAVSPPCREYNTIVTDMNEWSVLVYASKESLDWNPADRNEKAGLLAHEIGHNLNVPHHGAGEDMRTIDGARAWVACPAGQHSGEDDCFMRYNVATYFYDRNPVPRTLSPDWLLPGQLHPFRAQCARSHFCDTPNGSSACGGAAAGCGNCLRHLRVKSY